jgi:1-acyl-sn-glycerol-3-phosphate acyltransferase
MALEAQVPVVPVAIIGTYDALPFDRKVPKPGRVEIRFGKPLDFHRHYGNPADRFVLRSVTDEIMYEIMLMSGQEYVDEYGSKAKELVARGTPPKSTAPGARETAESVSAPRGNPPP